MDTSAVENLEERLAQLTSMPLEARAEELGRIHDQLRDYLDSPAS
jgi:hypothetical protein